jgi:rhodanese-related sulfurtransferase
MMTVVESTGPEVIEAATLAGRLGRHEAVTVLDVRRPERWSEDRECIPSAVWVPHDEIPRRGQDLPRDRDLVVYCS